MIETCRCCLLGGLSVLVLALFVLATWLHLVTFKSCGCCLFGGLLGLGRVLLGFGNLAASTVVVFETCRCCLLGGLSVLVLVLFVLATRLPNPFWHALLFDLDIELHVQVETFTKMLLEETWPLPLLGAWQNSLRSEAHKVWFPRRLWYELIHHTDLTLSPAQVRSRLRHLVVGGGREQTSRFHP